MDFLSINDHPITCTKSFVTDQCVKPIINGYVHNKHKVEKKTPQGLPVSSILFLIYIGGVFTQIEARLPQISCLFFLDDLAFLRAGRSVTEIT